MSAKNKSVLVIICLLVIVASFLVFFALTQAKKTIAIATFPVGAKCEIDGIEVKVPAKIKLSPGIHQIEISLKDYESIKTEIKISSFWGKRDFRYTLNRLPNTIRSGTTPGADTKRVKEIKEMEKKFSYFNLLPYEGISFYIDIPYKDGRIPVYIFKENEKQGKKGALLWFASHGVNKPEKLNIIWRYDQR